MVVQHNLTAMNSNRMLGLTTKTQAKSTEKLSSGYKVNRAADDAAGLSISEKMRRQIRGLTQASANASDGISCVQTAEGALNEVHDMLQRINELAVKGENGTLTSVDRSYIQSEVKQLMSEIDRVQSTTTFNEQSLLDGSFSKKGLQVGAEAGQHIAITIANMNTNQLIAQSLMDETKFKVNHLDVELDAAGAVKADSPDKLYADDTKNVLSSESGVEITLTASMLNKFYAYDPDFTNKKLVENNNLKENDLKNLTTTQAGHNVVSGTTAQKLDEVNAPTAADFAALNAFAKSALKTVSQQRSDLGAIQNRLEHTINNLDNITENTTAAESQIRDTDMATEMVRYSNNNILMQAGQAMLAQANQSNQGVLSLLG